MDIRPSESNRKAGGWNGSSPSFNFAQEPFKPDSPVHMEDNKTEIVRKTKGKQRLCIIIGKLIATSRVWRTVLELVCLCLCSIYNEICYFHCLTRTLNLKYWNWNWRHLPNLQNSGCNFGFSLLHLLNESNSHWRWIPSSHLKLYREGSKQMNFFLPIYFIASCFTSLRLAKWEFCSNRVLFFLCSTLTYCSTFSDFSSSR